jgi:mono/diheme cytochrome c family protein
MTPARQHRLLEQSGASGAGLGGRLLRLALLAGLCGLAITLIFGVYLWVRVSEDEPRPTANPREHFMYGSTGGDRLAGIPAGIWNALPELCSDYMPEHYEPGSGYRSLGFLYEPGVDHAIGTTSRRHAGFDRVFVNCAVCHTGTYRETAESEPEIVVGMPAHGLDLNGFRKMITECVLDPKFNPIEVVGYAEQEGADYGPIDRTLMRLAVPVMKELLLLVRYRFRFLDMEPDPGPGRFDTFGPGKALLGFDLDSLPEREQVGLNDYPSIWNQRARAGMQLHWDGNNDSVDERNRSAGFGSGALPVVADRESIAAMRDWVLDAKPPPYPLPIEDSLARRGGEFYKAYCADCHGRSGSDFTGAYVGEVVPIAAIGTDPCRLDNYTRELAAAQNTLYAGYPEERFRRFRKTWGYANMPLDGLWLRGPYLHNGSVPTVRDLLEPSERRPAVFYRGYDVLDPERLGFVSDVEQEGRRRFFRYETRCVDGEACAFAENPDNVYPDHRCAKSPWAGNGNRGHEGALYGTELADADKDALVEYLKTF